MDNKKKEIDGRQIFTIGLIVFAIVTSIWFILIPYFKGKKYFTDLEYKTVIRQVEVRPGHRGARHIYTDSAWRILSSGEEKIADYIQPEDSIVKEKGDKKITVYRHSLDGSLLKKEFE